MSNLLHMVAFNMDCLALLGTTLVLLHGTHVRANKTSTRIALFFAACFLINILAVVL